MSVTLNSQGDPNQLSGGKMNPHRNIFFPKDDDQEIYHIGIIDYLQLWDKSKKRERWFKTKVLQADAS